MSDEKATGKQRGNIDNLRPFKPGQSGNPSGRPKGSVSLISALKRRLRESPHEVDELVAKWLECAKGGDMRAMKELLDRLDGAVKQQVEAAVRRIEVVEVEPGQDNPDEAARGPADDPG